MGSYSWFTVISPPPNPDINPLFIVLPSQFRYVCGRMPKAINPSSSRRGKEVPWTAAAAEVRNPLINLWTLADVLHRTCLRPFLALGIMLCPRGMQRGGRQTCCLCKSSRLWRVTGSQMDKGRKHIPSRGRNRHKGREAGRSLHLGNAVSISTQLEGWGPLQKEKQRRVERQMETQSRKISNWGIWLYLGFACRQWRASEEFYAGDSELNLHLGNDLLRLKRKMDQE